MFKSFSGSPTEPAEQLHLAEATGARDASQGEASGHPDKEEGDRRAIEIDLDGGALDVLQISY